VAEPIVAEIHRRLAFLDRVGTDYLTLDRTPTHSGGCVATTRTVRLAYRIGFRLVEVLYLHRRAVNLPSNAPQARQISIDRRLIAAGFPRFATAGKHLSACVVEQVDEVS